MMKKKYFEHKKKNQNQSKIAKKINEKTGNIQTIVNCQ